VASCSLCVLHAEASVCMFVCLFFRLCLFVSVFFYFVILLTLCVCVFVCEYFVFLVMGRIAFKIQDQYTLYQ
jgi:hypothetical protein